MSFFVLLSLLLDALPVFAAALGQAIVLLLIKNLLMLDFFWQKKSTSIACTIIVTIINTTSRHTREIIPFCYFNLSYLSVTCCLSL